MTDFDPGTPPAEALENDHLFAAWTASVAGELLLQVLLGAQSMISRERVGREITDKQRRKGVEAEDGQERAAAAMRNHAPNMGHGR